MRNAVAASCLAILFLMPFRLQTEQPKSATSIQNPPGQNPPPATKPQMIPIPDKFVNLQVLPKDIPKDKLVAIMKRFSITFGVYCSYCHMVSDQLTEGNFDSDEKPNKQKARELLKFILEATKNSSGG